MDHKKILRTKKNGTRRTDPEMKKVVVLEMA